MKKFINIILWIIILLFTTNSYWAYDIPWASKVQSVSNTISHNSDLVQSINTIWFNILDTIVLALEWLLIIYIVYVWASMIWTMWANEEDLAKAKRQIWYSVVALLFINMPKELYNAFHRADHGTIWSSINNSSFLSKSWDSNLFFDVFNFWYTFGDKVVWFLEIMILAIAIVMIIYQWIRLLTSRWREERVTETKNKITYSILALVFVWIVEAWKNFAIDLSIPEFKWIFGNLVNLALFFAWPVAFFFLTLAWYYYVTSAGDEEKVKKAKSIVINTILWTLILLASYTFLLDIARLFTWE